MRWFFAFLVMSGGCSQGLVEDEVEGLRRLEGTVNFGRKGRKVIEVDVDGSEHSVLFTAAAPDGFRTHVLSVEDPNGDRVFDAVSEAESEFSTTNGGFVSRVTNLPWPRVPSDALTQGTWSFEVGLVNDEGNYAKGSLDIAALLKEDADPTTGLVQVNLVYAGSAADDVEAQEAVMEALETWRTVYDAVGLELEVSEFTWPEGELQPPILGTGAEWQGIGEQGGVRSVNVVLVPSIVGLEDVFGVAGDIPGPLVATPASGVLVSLGLAAGVNGKFETLEIRILGETMAHEVGHYLGLFHPVEVDWEDWDALEDTVQCGGETPCTNKLGDHMMFPFPVCGIATCQPQTVISEDQGSVLQSAVGVD